MSCTTGLHMGALCHMCLRDELMRQGWPKRAASARARWMQERYREMLQLRRQFAPGQGSPTGDPDICKLAEGYPYLTAFLCQTAWAEVEGSTPRTTGTVTLFTEDGCWKGFANDRDAKMQVCLSADTLSELLTALDEAIAEGSGGWRRTKDKPAGRGRG